MPMINHQRSFCLKLHYCRRLLRVFSLPLLHPLVYCGGLICYDLNARAHFALIASPAIQRTKLVVCLKCYVIHFWNMCFVLEFRNVKHVQASSMCDVADAHAMFKIERSTDADSRLLCVVGAGIQIVSVGTLNGT